MRLDKPRVLPLSDDEQTPEQRAELAVFYKDGGAPLNILRTLGQVPEALKGFLAWGYYVLSRVQSLNSRQREIVILRAGYRCRSGSEFAQHTRLGLRAKLTMDEINALKAPIGSNWTPAEAVLIQATDELVDDHFVTEPTWQELLAHYTLRLAIDVVFTASQYVQVSSILNTFGVQPEPGVAIDPDLVKKA